MRYKIYVNGEYRGFLTEYEMRFKFCCMMGHSNSCGHILVGSGPGTVVCENRHENKIEIRRADDFLHK